jgi:putative transposase
VEGRLLPMLEGDKDLTLRKLNQATQAWVELDYNSRFHHEIKQKPIDCYLKLHNVGRESPDSQTLRNAFQVKATRTQRKSDGTISVKGKRFELPSIYSSLNKPTIRYCRWDLSSLHLLHPDTNERIAVLYPINKTENANAKRRLLPQVETQTTEAPASETPPLLKQLLADYAATGLPQSYLPKDEIGE